MGGLYQPTIGKSLPQLAQPIQSQNTGTTLVNGLQDVNSVSQVVSATTQCMCRAHETSSSAKIYLVTVGIQDGKCLVCRPRLIDVVEGCNNYAAACLNSSTYCNLYIYTAILYKERDYLHKKVDMSHMPSTAISGVMQ